MSLVEQPSPPTKQSMIGIGMANDLYESGIARLVNDFHKAGLCQYLVVYVYENYTSDFMRGLRRQFPGDLKYVWHTSGDFELPYDGPSLSANWERIREITDIWQPEWATEDIVLTNFARTRPPGHPNYIQPFLTEECLAICIRRQKEATERVAVPLYPEVPHFYMPGPEEMHLSTFFRRFVEATGAMLNFDVGHFFSYNMLRRRPPLDGIDEFPLEFIGEMHTAGGMVGDAEGLSWVDDYAAPLNPLTEEALRHLIPRCQNLRAVFTETIGAEPWVVHHNLELLNSLFPAAQSIDVPLSTYSKRADP